MTVGSVRESNPEDKVNNSPNFLRVNQGGGGGGADSEVWNRVYMVAPVKKFGRVRLSSIFLQNKYGGECRCCGSILSLV